MTFEKYFTECKQRVIGRLRNSVENGIFHTTESTVNNIWIRNSCKTVDFLKKSNTLLLDVNITLLNFILFQHKRN